MMPNSVNRLETKYSPEDLHERVKALTRRNLIKVRQDTDAILIDPEALGVLRRLAKLEEEYDSLRIAFMILENELLAVKNSQPKSGSLLLKINPLENLIQIKFDFVKRFYSKILKAFSSYRF